VQFVSEDASKAVVFAFQQFMQVKPVPPPLRLAGLDEKARYRNDLDNGTYSGATYMNGGLNILFPRRDYQSRMIWLEKV
jgi:alpha-galactosidase